VPESHHTFCDNKNLDTKQAAPYFKEVEKYAKPLPVIVWVIIIATVAALIGGQGLLGFRMSGLAWFVPLLFSVLVILRDPGNMRFPLKLWLPWILLLVLYLVTSEYRSLQRTVQLICPIIVGMAVSTCNIKASQLKGFIFRSRYLAGVIIVIALWHTGVLLSGRIPMVTGLAPQVGTALLLCNLFAAMYVSGNRKDLFWWCLMVAVPIFAVTRTAIAVAGLTLPLTFAPLRKNKRILFLIIGILVAMVLFFTPRIQHKMFYSGRGKITDLKTNDFRDTGRKFMWKQITLRIKQKPWLGHGTGSGENFTKKITGGLAYPHNDWLLTLHDQGVLGATVYALCLIMAVWHALRMSMTTIGETRLLFLAGAASFVSLALMMITDNIMVYASYFGNLHFTILGLAYSSAVKQKRVKPLFGTFGRIKL
jgi:O-antigen ligase